MSVQYRVGNGVPDFSNPEDPQLNYLDRPVWGARGIASVVNKPVKAVQQMLYRRQLDADKWLGQWVSTPRRLLNGIVGDPQG